MSRTHAVGDRFVRSRLAAAMLTVSILLVGCSHSVEPLFVYVDADDSGITFVNRISVNDTFNPLTYEYIYNGAGVGVGDFNGDGLPDLYFAGNQVSGRLYLNRGNWRFEDITEASGTGTDRWGTGVAVADVNGDGRDDIYVSVAGYGTDADRRANLLFLNEGNDAAGVPRFLESARTAGLADTSYTSQTAFLDYDLDGDVDAYVVNNALEGYNRNRLRPIRRDGSAPASDRLYRNDGGGRFSDVSDEAGIQLEGYGLGVTVSDLNRDGWPDLYVANDFLSNDLVWINNQDGTFTDRAASYFRHTSHNGMGVDIADVNNDLLPDVMELDMLPADNYRQKMMTPYVNRDRFTLKADYGYQDQYMRNTLQLHRGMTERGEASFSDIGFLAGIAATDWSWAVLLADFDLDGWKDAYVTNGYRKDVTNLDFISYGPYNQLFGREEAKARRSLQQLASLEEVPLANYFFRNDGGLSFSDQSRGWGSTRLNFSTGAAYADLDGDGDLDLVTSTIDGPVELLRNTTRESGHGAYLAVDLVSAPDQPVVEHTEVRVYAGDLTQAQEMFPVRGYLSSNSRRLHFGLGSRGAVDSLVVRWNDGTRQVIPQPSINRVLRISYREDHRDGLPRRAYAGENYPYRDSLLPFVHQQHDYDDFRQTFTLLRGYGQPGPVLTQGDVDGDGREELIVSGNRGDVLLLHPLESERGVDTLPCSGSGLVTDVVLLDVDRDGDLDLYAVVGGTHLPATDPAYRDRLYRNDGKGRFTRQPTDPALPAFSGSCVAAADFDGDGWTDLFVGGHARPGAFPVAAGSRLLRNVGGRFEDVTPVELRQTGLVTDALMVAGKEGGFELILAREWQTVQRLIYRKGKWRFVPLEIVTHDEQSGTLPTGWWSHLNAADVDGDGDLDLLAGNLGQNLPFRPTPDRPVHLYAKDFDGNGAVDPLVFTPLEDELVPFHERDLLLRQIPSMKRRFPDYERYARARLDDVLTESDREGSQHFTVADSRSYFLENLGDGRYRATPLPALAQLGPIRASVFHDFTGDGRTDLFIATNLGHTEITQIGKFDGDYGTLLVQSPGGEWIPAPASLPRPRLRGEVTGLAVLRERGSILLAAASVSDTLRGYRFPYDAQTHAR